MPSDGGLKPGHNAPYSFGRGASLAIVALYPLVHIAAVWTGLFLTTGTQTATLWTSNALLLATLIILDRRWWLPLLAGLALAEVIAVVFLTQHLDTIVSLHFSVANVIEGLTAAFLWKSLVGQPISIFRLRDCTLLVFVVAPVAPALSGLVAAFGAVGLDDAATFFSFWQLWWAADALGILIIASAILAWFGTGMDRWRIAGSRPYQLLALIAAIVALAGWIFSAEPASASTILGLPYVLYPLLIVGALRFGTTVSATLVLIVAGIAIIGTDSGNGPYAISSYSVYQRILSLQMFLAAAAISALLLSAAFSDRLHALRELRGSEEKFAKAFHATPDAVCISRISDGHVMDVNRSFEAISGHSRDEAIGSTLQQLELDPLEKRRREFLEHDDLQAKHAEVDCLFPHKTGSTTECQSAFEIAEIEDELCMVCVLHDMTSVRDEERKRRELEAELLQARKMEAIGQLTGGIAHDFNNFLFAIMGNAKLAEERAADLQNDDLNRFLGEIRESSNRARDLVAQLLTFSRNMPGNPVNLDVTAAIEEVLRLVRQVLPSSMDINTVLPTERLTLHVDEVQLQQLLLNLCVNARDATEGSGRIDIVAKPVRGFRGDCASCGKAFAGDFVCLTVRDSGPGIRDEAVTKIFEPFYTSKKDAEGTGLGLAVVHGVAHGHGGHVVVDGTPGRTTISSYLPLAETEALSVTAQRIDGSERIAPSELRGNVLLVDDEPAVLEVFTQLLEKHGLRVTATDNAAEALSRFKAKPEAFDLVITDQTMPNMRGAALAGKILEVRPDLPIILCSGYSEDIDERRARDFGIHGFHRKPVNFRELIAEIAEIRELHAPPG